jgi:hypothetical protein
MIWQATEIESEKIRNKYRQKKRQKKTTVNSWVVSPVWTVDVFTVPSWRSPLSEWQLSCRGID